MTCPKVICVLKVTQKSKKADFYPSLRKPESKAGSLLLPHWVWSQQAVVLDPNLCLPAHMHLPCSFSMRFGVAMVHKH